jgi:hypothetical protein
MNSSTILTADLGGADGGNEARLDPGAEHGF